MTCRHDIPLAEAEAADAEAEAEAAVERVLPVDEAALADVLWLAEDFSTVNCWDWARMPSWLAFSRLIW